MLVATAVPSVGLRQGREVCFYQGFLDLRHSLSHLLILLLIRYTVILIIGRGNASEFNSNCEGHWSFSGDSTISADWPLLCLFLPRLNGSALCCSCLSLVSVKASIFGEDVHAIGSFASECRSCGPLIGTCCRTSVHPPPSLVFTPATLTNWSPMELRGVGLFI